MTSDSINTCNSPKGQTGFTLLEIIVALAIFAVIFSLIFRAYTGTYRNIDIAETQAEIYEMARTTLIRIVEDLESTYIPKDSNDPQENENKESFVGQKDFIEDRRADRLRFFSKSHIDISESPVEGGDAKIVYYPLEKEDESISLYRSDTPGNLEWPEENTKGWIICEGLYSISFTYTDKNGNTHNDWNESVTNSNNKLPSIINIKLEFTDRDNPETPLTFTTAVAMPLAN
ncbi:MAG: type II secretion system protein [Desulfobacteraceae bacterium]|jgi:general secretion pathway protein J